MSFACQNVKTITFVNPWDRGPGRTSAYKRTVCHTRIEASTAVVGQVEWNADYRISSARFFLNDADSILVPEGHESLIFANEVSDIPDLYTSKEQHFDGNIEAHIIDRRRETVLHAVGKRLSVTIQSAPRREGLSLEEIGGVVDIEFNDPKTISEYFDDVTEFTSFLALSQGSRVRPFGLRVTSMDAPKDRSIDGGDYENSFEVRYLWSVDAQANSESRRSRTSIFSALTESDRAEFQNATVCWLNRETGWSRAHHLSAGQLSYGNSYGRDRLFSAFAWLESIPAERALRLVSRSALKMIQRSADDAAQRIGAISARTAIKEALQGVNRESKKQKLDRHIEELLSVNITYADMSNFREDCLGAWSLRGKLIHGNAMDGDYDLSTSVDLIQAIELLSAFLTMRNLGIEDSDLVARLSRHELGKYISPFRGPRIATGVG